MEESEDVVPTPTVEEMAIFLQRPAALVSRSWLEVSRKQSGDMLFIKLKG